MQVDFTFAQLQALKNRTILHNSAEFRVIPFNFTEFRIIPRSGINSDWKPYLTYTVSSFCSFHNCSSLQGSSFVN